MVISTALFTTAHRYEDALLKYIHRKKIWATIALSMLNIGQHRSTVAVSGGRRRNGQQQCCRQTNCGFINTNKQSGMHAHCSVLTTYNGWTFTERYNVETHESYIRIL